MSPCPALAHVSFLLIITDLSYPKAWAALLATDRLSCSQDTQWSGQGDSRAGDTSAGGRGRTPADPAGLVNACPRPETLWQGTTQPQTPAAAHLDALDHSVSCSVSLASHWLWKGEHVPSTNKPVLRSSCVPEGMRQENTISTSSERGCFQLQQPLIQLLASTQAAAVTSPPVSSERFV